MKLVTKLEYTEESFAEAWQHIRWLAESKTPLADMKNTQERIREIFQRQCNHAFQIGVEHGRKNPEEKP